MFRHSSVFQFKNGDHTCLFYRTANDLMRVLIPFIADGLRRNERCFCAQKPEILKQLVYDLRYLGINAEQEIRRGALELRSEDETYFPNRRFEPQVMMDMLIRSMREAKEKGFLSFRSAGELSWAVEGRNECDLVIGYEKLVNEYYPGKPAIGLCQYCIDKFPPEVLKCVVNAHRMHLVEPSGSAYSSLSLRNGHWAAELVADKTAHNPRYYYVVHGQQPQEVLGWGVAPNFESANASIIQLALGGSADNATVGTGSIAN
jgi:hypothetical protein